METQDLLPIIDRMIGPIVGRLDQMDHRQREDTLALHAKLDIAATVAHQVTSMARQHDDFSTRMTSVEDSLDAHKAQLDQAQGRNQVIIWLMGGLGGPIVVALCLAGIAKLFNIDLGA